ncbi:hypothetical protein Hsw_0948 [Hymenobacter swuensis DY53]|uniref:Uncharacterized protein n=1 Tax=Hymenobacter swuensis DY53 TaxID=1227739 RepID=W8EVK0_9BACT|nr:hypothetical protein Hsw_0948 [Hymenobacter swuensis DY53]
MLVVHRQRTTRKYFRENKLGRTLPVGACVGSILSAYL